MLEAEEQAPLRPFVGGQCGDVLALQQDPAAGHDVRRVGEQRVGEGRLAGAVRAHQGVQRARLDLQGHAPQDLPVVDGDVEVVYLERWSFGCGGGSACHGPSVITLRP